ncbi:MAG: class I SAM-dependent methyltransferase [Pseudomonadales bacterium]|nr:class I SAM-dependent methyltransferase [Pseudomonadales bacterium]
MSSPFISPVRQLNLHCNDKKNSQDQAWNQADNYLIQQLLQIQDHKSKKVVCINDAFGGLSLQYSSDMYSDSAISRRWIRHNAKLNQVTEPNMFSMHELSDCQGELYLMRLPKNLHYFQYLLATLSNKTDITVIVSGMQKHWPSTFYQTANDFFANVEVLPGVKKAKCMLLSKGLAIDNFTDTHQLSFPEFDLQCRNYPNVFAREKLDIGTRFFLEHFPDLAPYENIIDLACGNGLLGIQALKKHAHLHCDFIDESAFAIRSAADSLQLNDVIAQRFSLHQMDIFERFPEKQVDAILCNPPFHQQHNVSTDIAQRMIEHSAKHLRKNGSLYLIANRHLPYKPMLKRAFSGVNIAAENSKFFLYQSIK